MARLQVGQKSSLASKSSKSFCRSGGVIRIGTLQACLASHTIILPKSWPRNNAGNALTTFSKPPTIQRLCRRMRDDVLRDKDLLEQLSAESPAVLPRAGHQASVPPSR